ncbi:MAG TPA: NmrA family NAD(P)-binding protein [Verrucomicrobiae bacterium]|jgi:NAD(P)H dehydrogenase (quinone)|nr:NmrA family NAD(P)-binding protein [Verrucomicrobiae bacterium]
MHAIMGITGQIGGVVARALLASEQPVRAIVRDAAKGQAWSVRGCEVALATIEDPFSLAAAFRGVESVFMLVPPNFDPLPGFPEAQAMGKALRFALEQANPARVVYLSTIGAQASESNLLTQHTIIERALGGLPNPVTFLRPAWFLENSSWDLAPARDQGVIPSFLQPLDRPVPMVGTADIGKVAAELLQGTWKGHRVVELEGPERVTPNQIAATFARLLGRPVRMEAVPRESWEALFKSQGMKNPIPRIRMLDGFNEGWIDFGHGEAGTLKGTVALETVLNALIKRS